ncbi:MAG: sulfotransferase family 2 domain-containing protein, partial [Pseudomonadota bacterium]
MTRLRTQLLQHFGGEEAFNWPIHIWQHPSFIYVSTPKNACSTTKASLNMRVARDVDPGFRIDEMKGVHKRDKMLLRTPNEVGDEEMDRLLTSPDVVRFCFVRDPLQRLISAYHSKLSYKHKRQSPHRQALFAHLGLSLEENLEIEDVAEIFAEDAAARYLDEHWRPQNEVIAYGIMPFSAIGRFEIWSEDFAEITTQIFGAPVPPVDTRRFNRDVTPHTFKESQATPRLLKAVKKAYAADYAMFKDIEKRGLAVNRKKN